MTYIKMDKKQLLLMFLLILPWPLSASGGEPFAFLKLGVGARAMGMGGAFSSVAGDATAPYYNPAGMLDMTGFELHAESHIMTFGRSLNFVSTGRPFMILNTLYSAGVSWYNFSGGSDLEARSSNSPEPDSVFSHNAHVFFFDIGAKISDIFMLGGNFKVLYQGIDSARGIGFAFDIGAIANITDEMRAAFTIDNIGSGITWSGSAHAESVSQVLTLGASYSVNSLAGVAGLKLLPAMDMVYNTASGFRIRAGAELSMNDFFFLRAGYNNALTCGMGLWFRTSKIFTIKLEYALAGDTVEPGAITHRLAASVVYVIPESGVKTERPAIPAAGGSGEQEQQKNRAGSAGEYDW
ncbi:MAG: hypothetical protein LLG37_00640 [Spirochaetia bacterium]|nr:hypothetical protein [Spirochaetia bacterium]